MYDPYPSVEREQFFVALGWQKSSGDTILLEDAKYGKQNIYINSNLRKEGKKGRVVIHPGYKGVEFNETTKVNVVHDIAIIVLPEEIEFSKHADSGDYWDEHAPDKTVARGTFVRPICMPDLNKKRQVEVRPLNPWTFAEAMKGDKSSVWITGFGKLSSGEDSEDAGVLQKGHVQGWVGVTPKTPRSPQPPLLKCVTQN